MSIRSEGDIEIYAPGGELVWRAKANEKSIAPIPQIAEPELAALVSRFTQDSGASFPISRRSVIEKAEELGFLSRRGNIKGFLTILPRAALLDSAIESFIQPTLAAHNAVRIDFPSIFDNSPKDTRELTQSYEQQGRMFAIKGKNAEMRLSYAADPGLFAWLRGRQIDCNVLPYAMYSPLEGFRRFQSGEIAGVDIQRQYRIPDLHIICTPQTAQVSYLRHIVESADDIRFFFGESFIAFHDIWNDVYEKYGSLGSRTAAQANSWTVVRKKMRRPRYYGVKSGLVLQAGFGDIRIVTLQMDDTNAARFDLSLNDGTRPEIIHATLTAGWPKILPLLLGRGLADIGPKEIPTELSAVTLEFLPVAGRHTAYATDQCARLVALGVRSAVSQPDGRPLRQRLGELRSQWRPWVCVIGDNELNGARPRVMRLNDRNELSLAQFTDRVLPRLKRCTVPHGLLNVSTPFVSTC